MCGSENIANTRLYYGVGNDRVFWFLENADLCHECSLKVGQKIKKLFIDQGIEEDCSKFIKTVMDLW